MIIIREIDRSTTIMEFNGCRLNYKKPDNTPFSKNQAQKN